MFYLVFLGLLLIPFIILFGHMLLLMDMKISYSASSEGAGMGALRITT